MALVRGHRLATDFSILVYKKGDAKTSNIKQTTWVYRLRSISNFEVLEGGEGNSFYGSRFGGTTVCKGDEELRGATVC